MLRSSLSSGLGGWISLQATQALVKLWRCLITRSARLVHFQRCRGSWLLIPELPHPVSELGKYWILQITKVLELRILVKAHSTVRLKARLSSSKFAFSIPMVTWLYWRIFHLKYNPSSGLQSWGLLDRANPHLLGFFPVCMTLREELFVLMA
ncbi:hypothetical protein D3C81_1790540 [compost metagenome]